ncbi:MAG TPA: signal peptidase II [Steroidobacteraceae bacterium]|nr:lipoprotein signal peptidase [Steroidobacteraceae bacterium]HQW08426.1 signal peptidase II [Steroidobacteraceae bacterium]HQX46726.1 signal peptidase II [Steroidobacteraceae bacterium]HQX79399.1 signal peptidase II [Steroidobacteraceae bacterium]HQZ80901.1 signal peptidase II [Steroidobacteraceae bacterium]
MSGWRWLPLSASIIVLDQASKAWIERHFQLYESVTLLPVLDITRLHNPGAAFSFLAGAGGWQRWFFTGLALVVSVGILVWLRGVHARAQAWLACGLTLILGGALGNVIDRMRHGFVIDFVHAHWNDAWFPAFNVADAAITVGAACMIIDALLESRR